METKIKEMNKEQRFAHCMMIFRTYAAIMTDQAILYDNPGILEIWRDEAKTAWRILKNMSIMRGKEINLYNALR